MVLCQAGRIAPLPRDRKPFDDCLQLGSRDGSHQSLLPPEPGVYSAPVRARLIRALAAGAVVVGVGAALHAADSGTPGPFAVAVLRRDGIIVPFAAFDGKRWSSPWPPPAVDLTVPIGLSAVPSKWWGPAKRALDHWQALLGTPAEAPRTLNVVQPDWIETHCQRQIGLRTDYRPAAVVPARTAQPYPKDGIAVSPPQAIEPIAIVPPEGADAQRIAPALLEAFNRAERLVEGRFGHTVKRRAREGVVPTVEAVYAFGDEPRIYYVEAARVYRQLGQPPDACAQMAFGTGWFVQEGDQVRSLLTVVDLLNCDRLGASYMLPLGVVRIGSRVFWLAQFSGYDHERFVVLEMKAKAVEAALSVWGGGC